MSSFESNDEYRRFAAALALHRRYVRDDRTERFMKTLLAQADAKSEVLPVGTVLWRAQLGHEWDKEADGDGVVHVPVGYPAARMKPLPNRAREGRANPKGIPYLYLGTNPNTAMAEVRPWIGSGISLGHFEVVRELRVVNCTEHEPYQMFWGYETPESCWDDNVWSDVDDAFSRPVAGDDDTAEYVPTQVIAELFNAGGFDGVAYASALGDGHNLALFDLDAVQLVSCAPYRLKSMSFQFEQIYNPYFVSRGDDSSAQSIEQRHQTPDSA